MGPEGSVPRTTMFAIGHELGEAVNVTLPRITFTNPALLSAEGEFEFRGSAVSNPFGYGYGEPIEL